MRDRIGKKVRGKKGRYKIIESLTKIGGMGVLFVAETTDKSKTKVVIKFAQEGKKINLDKLKESILLQSEILDLKASPVIVNVNKTLNMDPRDCKSLITDKTKVLLPVHMLGVPADMNSIMEIAKKHDLYVLSDEIYSEYATQSNDSAGVHLHSILKSLPH